MKNVNKKMWCLLACLAVPLAPMGAHGAEGRSAQNALDAGEAPGPGSVLLLAAGLMVAGCMRRRGHGVDEFGE